MRSPGGIGIGIGFWPATVGSRISRGRWSGRASLSMGSPPETKHGWMTPRGDAAGDLVHGVVGRRVMCAARGLRSSDARALRIAAPARSLLTDQRASAGKRPIRRRNIADALQRRPDVPGRDPRPDDRRADTHVRDQFRRARDLAEVQTPIAATPAGQTPGGRCCRRTEPRRARRIAGAPWAYRAGPGPPDAP